MDNSFNFTTFLAALFCLLAGMFLAWLLYGRASVLPRRLHLALAVFRAIAVSLILWLLFSPLIRQLSYTLEKPIVIIAQDNSQSVAAVMPPGFDTLKYRQSLQRLSADLSDKYDVRTYSFSDHVVKGLDFGYKGKLSNAALLVSQLNDELMNRNVGALIIASDGIFNRGGNPAADAAALKAPVYTIGLGDTTARKDLRMVNVNSNELVYLDNDFKLEVQIEADQCAGMESRLTVAEGGKTVYQEMIRISGNQFSKNIPVVLKAKSLGMHQYTLSLSPLKDELSVKNNSQSVAIEVIDDREKILIAAAAPHPDLAAIRGAIAQNKHYELTLLTGEDLAKTDPKSYGLIILYQLPGGAYDARTFIEKVKLAKKPVWYILGAQSNISQFNQAQAGVNMAVNSRGLLYAYSDISKSLSSFDLDAAARKMIESFDPLQTPSGQLKIAGDYQTVLNQRRGKISTETPQLFFMQMSGQKTGYLIGEGLWKWKFSEAKDDQQAPVFTALTGKIVQYLVAKDTQRKFIVHPAKQSFDENEHILINASLYNDSYMPVNSPDVTIQLRDEHQKRYNFSFSRSGAAYQLDAGILPAGSYSYEAATALGTRKYTAKGSFFINTLTAEFQQTVANHQLLYQLSSQTNGRFYLPDHIQELKNELDKSSRMKTLSYEDRKYEELVDFKWLFVLILVLLSTEWFLRKRNGEI